MDTASSKPLFTVFIPTLNRAHTLNRALSSVLDQTFQDFEVLVVDDGSWDATAETIKCWRPSFGGRLRYWYQPNQGKHVAYNTAAQLARGELLALLDSDDVMLPEALEVLASEWESIPPEVRLNFAGVEGLCRDSNGLLHGLKFPREVMDSNYLEITQKHGVRGEKRHALRVDVLKRFLYPVVSGEWHVRPDYNWKRIAHHYQFRYVNKCLQVVDFRKDGLTRNARSRRLSNPGGLYIYYRDDLLIHSDYLSSRALRHSYSQYIRYGLRYGVSLMAQFREVPAPRKWLAALPRGVGDYLVDSIKKVACRPRA